MRKLAVASALLCFTLAAAPPSFAKSHAQVAAMRSANAMCKEKIDAKGLKGPARKDAFKECHEKGDAYN